MIRLGADIGGTKIRAVAVDDDDAVVAEEVLPSGHGPEQVLDHVTQALRTVATRARVDLADTSVGVGIPGPVDVDSGRVTHAVNLGIEQLDLGAELGRRLRRPVAVENDVKAAALGAFALLGTDSAMAYLNLGTGLAAGLVLDGRLWRGAGGVAGEIGHIPVREGGDVCACGQRGCLETLASGAALARRWPQGDGLGVTGLFDAADGGDAVASAVRGDFVNGVAAATRLLVLATGVERVVIGGGLSVLGERLRAAVLHVLEGWATSSPFLASLAWPHRVAVLPADCPVGAVGAAMVGEREGLAWRS